MSVTLSSLVPDPLSKNQVYLYLGDVSYLSVCAEGLKEVSNWVLVCILYHTVISINLSLTLEQILLQIFERGDSLLEVKAMFHHM